MDTSGITLHCPSCGHGFDVPSLATGEYACPSCGARMSMNVSPGGQTVISLATLPPAAALGGSPTLTDVRNVETAPQSRPPAPEEDDGPELHLEAGMDVAGFRLEEELGRGGMGVVWRATQVSLGRQVALKILPRRLAKSADFVSRFNREARALASLQHPNIVGILDKGEWNGVYYFVMEYVDGVTLREILSHGKLPARDALRYIPPLCDALGYAHSAGIVHRDIKPENILIDRRGNVKIADFGLARVVGQDAAYTRITNTMMVMGTPDYMAPEQRLSSKDVDHRADLYSLGVVIYEMLTGVLPLGSNFPPPSLKNDEVTPSLDPIVMRVLESDPSRRFQLASELATAVEEAEAGSVQLSGAVSMTGDDGEGEGQAKAARPPQQSLKDMAAQLPAVVMAAFADRAKAHEQQQKAKKDAGEKNPDGSPKQMSSPFGKGPQNQWAAAAWQMATEAAKAVQDHKKANHAKVKLKANCRIPYWNKNRWGAVKGLTIAIVVCALFVPFVVPILGIVLFFHLLPGPKRHDMRGASLSHQNLAGHDYSDQNLQGADFSGSNLQGANFSNCQLQGACFKDAHLSGANFSDAQLTGADLRRADLTGAKFTDAVLEGAVLTDANLSKGKLNDAKLTGAQLMRVNLQGAKMADARLVGVNLRNADLKGANLVDADLTGANVDGANFHDARLDDAKMPHGWHEVVSHVDGVATVKGGTSTRKAEAHAVAVARAAASPFATKERKGSTLLVLAVFVLALINVSAIAITELMRPQILSHLFLFDAERLVGMAGWAWWAGLFVQAGLVVLALAALKQRVSVKPLAVISLLVIAPGVVYWANNWEHFNKEVQFWRTTEADRAALPEVIPNLVSKPDDPETGRPWMPPSVTRERAIRAAMDLPAEQGSALIVAMLEHEDPAVRLQAARGARRVARQAFVTPLQKLTADEDQQVAMAAIDSLGYMALEHPGDPRRNWIQLANAFDAATHRHPLNGVRLIEWLGRTKAHELIERSGEGVHVGFLIRQTGHSDHRIQLTACFEITKYRTRSALPLIRELLGHTNPEVRRRATDAVEAFARTNFDMVAALLVEMLEMRADVAERAWRLLAQRFGVKTTATFPNDKADDETVAYWKNWLAEYQQEALKPVEQAVAEVTNGIREAEAARARALSEEALAASARSTGDTDTMMAKEIEATHQALQALIGYHRAATAQLVIMHELGKIGVVRLGSNGELETPFGTVDTSRLQTMLKDRAFIAIAERASVGTNVIPAFREQAEALARAQNEYHQAKAAFDRWMKSPVN